MSLDNLVGVNLEKVEPDASVIKRLIAAAERNIADSHIMEVSSENRFDAAIKPLCSYRMLHCRLTVSEH